MATTVTDTSPRVLLPRDSEVSGATSLLPDRNTFIDYFPATRAGYPGFIREYRFETTMIGIIEGCVKDTGDLNQYTRLPQQLNSGDFNERMYYQAIKEKMQHGVNGKEWRMPNEMKMSEEMAAQSRNYLKTAIKDVAVTAASLGAGKAMEKTGNFASKHVGNIADKFVKNNTVNKASKEGVAGNLRMKKLPFNLNPEYFSPQFNGGEHIINSFIEGIANIAHNELSNEQERKHDDSTINFFGDSSVGKAADFVTDLVPVISWCKTGVRSVTNFVLSYQTSEIADNMKKIEDQSNAAERNFNQKLKQTIYNDVSALQLEEIKKLIDIIGLTK